MSASSKTDSSENQSTPLENKGLGGSSELSTPSQLRWDESGQPFSNQFDDVYFSKANGLDESRYVFIEHNRLIQRWQALAPASRPFVIGETGFGTGLNFLAAWQTWQAVAPNHARLHFISVEKHPLSRDDLKKSLALWPELAELSCALLNQYPPSCCDGYHYLVFGNVTLTLIFAEAYDGLQNLLPVVNPGPNLLQSRAHWSEFFTHDHTVDAWFLDGFAPAKNPAMWREDVINIIAKLSGDTTTFATFTAAGLVKRNLAQAGFSIEKVPGFGRKREMLRGRFNPPDTEPKSSLQHNSGKKHHKLKPQTSWHTMARRQALTCRTATVIGAGIAGSTTAFALAQRDIQVTLLDQDNIASGSSGNPQAIIYGKLSHLPGAYSEFNLSALLYACRFYQRRNDFSQFGEQCGVMQLVEEHQLGQAKTIANRYGRDRDGFIDLLNPDQASSIAGVTVPHWVLWFPSLGWLAPKKLCLALTDHPNITTLPNTCAEHIEYKDQQWHCRTQNNRVIESDAIVLCAAQASIQFPQASHLAVKSIRGQVSSLRATPKSNNLKTVLCGEGYIAPAHEGVHCAGATFGLTSNDTQVCSTDHSKNLNTAHSLSSDLRGLDSNSICNGRVGFRCATRDYLPIVGALADWPAQRDRFAELRKNAKTPIDAAGEHHSNLFINLGHGSKGFTFAPICAEYIAALLSGSPLPLPREQAIQIHPSRFIMRDLIRNKL